ncbi:MAG TPA: caspase family protein [Pyrinomonadaceae bacterium]|nr:caspase family protein [Pyrinomonadaceae bacterium]
MAKGISIHVGVNVPPADLALQPLGGCVNDATAMKDLAMARGFTGLDGGEPLLMADADATHDDVLAKLKEAAQLLDAGDIFLFTFAGHGTHPPGSLFESTGDGRDETLVMSDKFLVDNVLRSDVWPKFKPGVRVVMVADSCHSGTVATVPPGNVEGGALSSPPEYHLEAVDGPEGNVPNVSGVRLIPEDKAIAHFAAFSDFYTQIAMSLASAENADPIQASVMLLAACKEFQEARESTINGKTHGVYTRALLNTWNTNGPRTYEKLLADMEPLPSQTPVLMMVENTPSFATTEAFKI